MWPQINRRADEKIQTKVTMVRFGCALGITAFYSIGFAVCSCTEGAIADVQDTDPRKQEQGRCRY
jgi:hypothetical protein